MKPHIVFSLMLSWLLLSCQEEEAGSEFQPKIQADIASISMTEHSEPANVLFNFANETISGMYPVSFDAKNARLLTKTALINWIRANEMNKSSRINRANRKILKKLLEQNQIQAILLKSDQAKPFKEAVYVLIPKEYRIDKFLHIGSILITDAQSSDDGGSSGGGTGEDGEEEEEESEEPCYTQSGTYLDATQSLNSSAAFSGCPPCLVECVDCDSGLAGQDDCINCQV